LEPKMHASSPHNPMKSAKFTHPYPFCRSFTQG
jgi:hypothetical protein